jgi:hypothetical protein
MLEALDQLSLSDPTDSCHGLSGRQGLIIPRHVVFHDTLYTMAMYKACGDENVSYYFV